MTASLSADGEFKISLEDDGSGMGVSNPERHGLSNIRSCASRIDASVQWPEREEGFVFYCSREALKEHSKAVQNVAEILLRYSPK